MDTKLGKAKGKLWRTVLKGMPDSLTGRTEPEYLEYPVPKNWERMAQEDISKFLLNVQAEAARRTWSSFREDQGRRHGLAGGGRQQQRRQP